ncbi:MAG: hypothetical protein Q7R72_00425 [bacterium]|nr:hypothetical protein [bacterium]
MKTQVDTSSEIGQKLAQIVLTKKLVDMFNLHPKASAKTLVEEAKKYEMSPRVLATYLHKELPKLVEEYLNDVEKEVGRIMLKGAPSFVL